jgi:glycine cleavage system H protein
MFSQAYHSTADIHPLIPKCLILFLLLAHEYIQVEGNIGTCGITDFAQSALGDIVYIDLPEVGDVFEKGDSFSSVESVKAASDVYCPVGGKVIEINSKLSDEPGLVNSEAETGAWFVKIEMKNPMELDTLLDASAYKTHCDNQPH